MKRARTSFTSAIAAAVFAAGLAAQAPRLVLSPAQVQLDGARDDNESRTMVASLVSAADAITRMSAVEFFEHYGEASRVLRHVGESPDSAALKIYELHRRHAEQVTCVIDSAISKFARQIREGNLPPTCLVRLVSDGSGPCPDQPEQDRRGA